jgi:hypothetical protein
MTNIVATNIVVTNSGIEYGLSPLACTRVGSKFVIPTSVRLLKQKASHKPQLAESLFKRIIDRNDVEELPVDAMHERLPVELDQRLDQTCSDYMRKREREGCSSTDAPSYLDRAKKDILLFRAVSAQLDGESIALVSNLTQRYFEAADIRTVLHSEIEGQWEKTKLFADTKKFDRSDFFVNGCLPPLLFFGGPFLLIAIIQLFWFLVAPTLESITRFVTGHSNVWWVTIVLWLIGIFLYWVRSRYRLVYGIAETLFGVILSYVALPNDEDGSPVKWLSFFAALYVMVRGLDNVGKSLRKDTVVRVWTWVFGDNYK